MFFALHSCICVVFEVIVCFVFVSRLGGCGQYFALFSTGRLSWGGGGPASQEESVFALRMRSESKKHNSYKKRHQQEQIVLERSAGLNLHPGRGD